VPNHVGGAVKKYSHAAILVLAGCRWQAARLVGLAASPPAVVATERVVAALRSLLVAELQVQDIGRIDSIVLELVH
jgi:hypothetical protein